MRDETLDSGGTNLKGDNIVSGVHEPLFIQLSPATQMRVCVPRSIAHSRAYIISLLSVDGKACLLLRLQAFLLGARNQKPPLRCLLVKEKIQRFQDQSPTNYVEPVFYHFYVPLVVVLPTSVAHKSASCDLKPHNCGNR